jgi:hypothetical protein
MGHDPRVRKILRAVILVKTNYLSNLLTALRAGFVDSRAALC